MSSLWTQLVDDFERQQIRYCLLRDASFENAPESSAVKHSCSEVSRYAEVDLLVAAGDLGSLQCLLTEKGFLRLRRWGYEPHQFFVAYDNSADLWLKLDVVTEIAFGRPTHAYRTHMADGCLERRVPCGSTFRLAPEDEFITLLLHRIVDKRDFTAASQSQLQKIAGTSLDEIRMSALFTEHCPPAIAWRAVRSQVIAGDWSGLLSHRPAIIRHLVAREPFAVRVRQYRDRALRKLTKVISFLRPETPTVALLAPDGAGKSTIASGVAGSFAFPGSLIYMGLYPQKEGGAPSLGIPGYGLISRVIRQWARFLRARIEQASGRLVLFDRYAYDAMLPSPVPLGVLSRVRRWVLAHTCPHADMVFVLDAPGQCLFDRKGQQTPERLELQRQAYLELARELPQLVVVDAAQDSNEVRKEVISRIWRACAQTRR